MNKFFLFLVFITEWAILMLEMAAFKMFVPYFGSSLYIWGNIIGIVMIGASLGYYFGGRIADAYPKENLLIKIVFFTGLFIVFIPFLSSFLLFFASGTSYPVVASFFYGILLFGLPAFLIEIVPPFIVRLNNKMVETTGKTAGSVYGFSTLGGVSGVIFSSFFTLPFLGTKETIFLAGIVLLLCGAFGLLKIKKI